MFFELFHDAMTAKHVPGLLANAMEFRDQYIPTPEERKVMHNILQYKDMEDFKPPHGKDGKDKYNRKMLLVLVAYMMRLEETNAPELAKAKETILKLSPSLIELLLDAAAEVQKAIGQG